MSIKRIGLGVFAAASIVVVAAIAVPSQQTQKEASEQQKPIFAAITVRDGCMHNSYEPEVYSFYGSPQTISKKLSKFEMGLFDRRVFMFLVESDKFSQLVLFERPKGDKTGPFSVLRWGGPNRADSQKRVAELRQKATDAILANKGFDCIGGIVTNFVKALQPEETSVKQSAPESALDALGNFSTDFKDQYIRVTAFILC